MRVQISSNIEIHITNQKRFTFLFSLLPSLYSGLSTWLHCYSPTNLIKENKPPNPADVASKFRSLSLLCFCRLISCALSWKQGRRFLLVTFLLNYAYDNINNNKTTRPKLISMHPLPERRRRRPKADPESDSKSNQRENANKSLSLLPSSTSSAASLLWFNLISAQYNCLWKFSSKFIYADKQRYLNISLFVCPSFDVKEICRNRDELLDICKSSAGAKSFPVVFPLLSLSVCSVTLLLSLSTVSSPVQWTEATFRGFYRFSVVPIYWTKLIRY